MKIEPLNARDLQSYERPQAPIRNKAEQINIIRSYFMNGTPAEIMKMNSLVGRPDVQPEVRDLICAIRSTYGGDRISQSPSVPPISFSDAEPSEAY